VFLLNKSTIEIYIAIYYNIINHKKGGENMTLKERATKLLDECTDEQIRDYALRFLVNYLKRRDYNKVRNDSIRQEREELRRYRKEKGPLT
jgi:hypothetical protein